MNAASFAFDGLFIPLIFRTNCNAADRISSSVTGGSKWNKGLMLRHMLPSSHRKIPLDIKRN